MTEIVVARAEDGALLVQRREGAPHVPDVVRMASLRRVLLRMGLLARVEEAVAALGGEAAIQWEFETHVERRGALTVALGQALGLTGAEMDDIARAAESLD